MAGQMGAMKLTTIPSHGVLDSIEQVDALKTFGQAYVYSNVIQTYTEGYLYCLPNINKGGAVQFFFSYNGSAAIKRVYNWSLKAWSGWSTL